MTGAEWMKIRFGTDKGANLSQIIVVVFALISVIGFLSYGFKGIGKFASAFLPPLVTNPETLAQYPQINPNLYGLILMAITTFYVVKGGMFSVVFTEVIQYCILSISSIAIGIIAMYYVSPDWCVLGGVGLDNGYAKKTLDSVKKYLATSNGSVLQQSAFQKYYVHLCEVSFYPPGYKENAGIFTHNNTWIQIPETIIGRGVQAMEYYKCICPPTKEDQIDIYRLEPYLYSQMTAGKDAPTPGEGKNL